MVYTKQPKSHSSHICLSNRSNLTIFPFWRLAIQNQGQSSQRKCSAFHSNCWSQFLRLICISRKFGIQLYSQIINKWNSFLVFRKPTAAAVAKNVFPILVIVSLTAIDWSLSKFIASDLDLFDPHLICLRLIAFIIGFIEFVSPLPDSQSSVYQFFDHLFVMFLENLWSQDSLYLEIRKPLSHLPLFKSKSRRTFSPNKFQIIECWDIYSSRHS